ncbi:hypothetical protein [Desulfoluna sp.]|uniref:hypothetical protein n=1 Tax=Desulfoluna sp. TaxID=2045199 RepID=UPI00260BA301|nr:hypothetical protein [Desulfoluna sp.]
MREAIRRIVLRMWPELSGGYHLDRYARVVKISDPPTAGAVCDRFRPMWAVDIEILTPEGEPAPGFPRFEAVPLPVPAAGPDAGFYLWPRPGTIVTVRWIEGRPDHPVIQHVYPMGLSMPEVPDGSGLWQQRPGVHQRHDAAGNWERTTDQDIKDTATNIEAVASALRSLQAKTVEDTASGSRTESSGEKTVTVSGAHAETVGASSTETITGPKTISAAAVTLAAPAIAIGAPGGVSLLPTLTSALGAITDSLTALASHTHPGVGQSPAAATVTAKATAVGSAKSDIDSLQG